MRTRAMAAGFTLIEMVMTITVLAFGLTGIFAVTTLTTAASADPVVRVQAGALAQAYLAEILARAYADPDGSEAGEDRASFDDVDDYDALAANGCVTTIAACPTLGSCACDHSGQPIAGLAGYSVAVSVQTGTLGGVAAKIVTVSVGHARFADLTLSLTGYRTSY